MLVAKLSVGTACPTYCSSGSPPAAVEMHPLVAQAIDTICLGRDACDWKLIDEDVLSALVQEFGENGLADRLYSEIPRSVPYEVVCDLFDLLAWRTNDNGASVTRTIEDWLRKSQDSRKLSIALHLEVYPFVDESEMKEVLSKLASKNSALAYRCNELIKSRTRK
jgi:hypothetical protein